jgi:hypothetical protein
MRKPGTRHLQAGDMGGALVLLWCSYRILIVLSSCFHGVSILLVDGDYFAFCKRLVTGGSRWLNGM